MILKPGGGILPITANTGGGEGGGGACSAFRYIEGQGFHKLKDMKGSGNLSVIGNNKN